MSDDYPSLYDGDPEADGLTCEEILGMLVEKRGRLTELLIVTLRTLHEIDEEIDIDGGEYDPETVACLKTMMGMDDNRIMDALIPDSTEATQ